MLIRAIVTTILLYCAVTTTAIAQGSNDARTRRSTQETPAAEPPATRGGELATIQLAPRNLEDNKRPGGIRGKLTDAVTGEELIQAMVSIGGTTQGTLTDFEGNYVMDNLQPGVYTLVFSYGGYRSDTVYNIQVQEGAFTEVNVKMQDINMVMETVEIVSERVAVTNNVALISDIKTSSLIETGISAQQIQNSQARSAGDVVRNLPGITIMEGSFVNIRGLNERYNVVMLNNVIAPSTESDKRAFSFNTIPSSMLDRVVVYRSPSPELYADMGGGIVRIYTKNVPEKNEFTASLQTSYRPGSTFEDVRSYKMPGLYSLGFYNGSSDVPETMPATGTVRNANGYSRAARADFGKSLDNNWAIRMQQTTPDVRASLGYGTRFRVGNKMVIGTSTTLRYSQTHTYFQLKREDYISGSIPQFYWDDDNYSRNISSGILHNWVFIFNQNHKLEVKNFFNQNASSQSIVRQGANLDGNKTEELRYSLYHENRTVYSGQLNGNHTFEGLHTQVDWTAAYNYGSKNIPNWRQTLLSRVQDSDAPFYLAPPSLPGNLQKGSQFWAKNTEDIYVGQLNLRTDFKFMKRDARLLYGGYYETRKRSFDSRAFALIYQAGPNGVYGDFSRLYVNEADKYTTDVLEYAFAEDKFQGSGGLSIEEITQPQDSYKADMYVAAGYLATELPLGSHFKLFGGVRYEKSEQRLQSRIGTGGGNATIVNVSNPFSIWMPTATGTYRFSDKHVLRGSYSRTVNRPELRELAPFNFYNFDFNFNVRGNDSLRTATIDHFEFRYEFYPSAAELITIGGFVKNFKDPIESIQEANAQFGTFSFLNADRAQSYGVELELRKNLEFISRSARNFSIISNLALIQSEVSFNDPAIASRQGGQNRPLQGQSSYVINAGLFYANKDKALNASVAYNVVGPSIAFVGNVFIPNTYIMPRHMLDLTLSKGLGKYTELSLGIQNLLNAEMLYVQDTDQNLKAARNSADLSVLRFFEQPYFSLGLRFKLTGAKE
ncbi:MAG: TonB-dependent receptor [Bacteroidetes bacterium]|nr:TonB-dependent receptor [Bacteroidota bacterium]